MKGWVTKRGNRWYPRVFVCVDENGKRIEKWGKSCATKKDAEKQLRTLVAEVENTYCRQTEKHTVSSFLRYWLTSYCEARLAANTIRGYRTNIEKHILPYIGDIKLDALTPRHVQQLYDKLAAKGMSSTSIRYVHNNLHKALEHAVKHEFLFRNPVDLVDPPLVRQYEATTLPPDAVKRLLVACRGTEIHLPVTLAATLGLRRGEALGLQWEDVDFLNKTITIRQSASFTNGTFTLSTPKTKSSRRTLLMPDVVQTALENALSMQKDLAVFIGPGFNPHNLVCCRRDGSPITSGALHHQYKALLKSCDLPDIRFHDLRHTNATLMLRSSVPAKIVSAMLGHSSIGITMDTYSHVMTDMQSPAVSAMNNALSGL